MKKLLLSVMVALAALGMNAQTKKGEGSLMGSLGYQTNYERFGLQAQGRYVIACLLLHIYEPTRLQLISYAVF